ncbi:MAG: hypothetical protein DCC55_08460 [Chloroflexi bacterium]|nr:MAG: hypothetical protein DCC55_08460 [Chloroflexota bacterium]
MPYRHRCILLNRTRLCGLYTILTIPAGFEQFVIDLSEPPPPVEPPDLDRLMEVAAKYQIEILGPLPEQE